jgi:hypothetical protein
MDWDSEIFSRKMSDIAGRISQAVKLALAVGKVGRRYFFLGIYRSAQRLALDLSYLVGRK